jgi:hypothetical protein
LLSVLHTWIAESLCQLIQEKQLLIATACLVRPGQGASKYAGINAFAWLLTPMHLCVPGMIKNSP